MAISKELANRLALAARILSLGPRYVAEGRVRRVAAACTAGLLAAVVVGVAPAAAARAPAWSVVPSPSARVPRDQLTDVSCGAARACVAVGSVPHTDGQSPLLKAWNGRKWVVQHVQRPAGVSLSGIGLFGVSCTSARACTVVGYSQKDRSAVKPLAERWNGRKWVVQHVVSAPDAILMGVSCTSARACTAVGSAATGALAEHWNGTRWAIQPNPADGTLLAVSCMSARACTAVGRQFSHDTEADTPLAETWNGSTWTVQPTPAVVGPTNILSGVSCTSAHSCVAVGLSNDDGPNSPLVETWNGTAWAITPVPDPTGDSFLSGVSCTSATACTAVGATAFTGLAERWNGVTWAVQPTASLAGAELLGVSCTSARACTAAGSRHPGDQVTLAARWNGVRWAIQPTPGNPAGFVANSLSGVSCTSARACVAVGSWSSASDSFQAPVAERWNGRRWSLQPAFRDPAGTISSFLTAVSCTSARSCTAVGASATSLNDNAPLAEHWNGRRWAIQRVPNPARSPGTFRVVLNAVSCTSARACTAVGGSGNVTNGHQMPVAERWNGTTWTIQHTPGSGFLSGVSCPSASTCTAVGRNTAERWNGTSWTIQSVPGGGNMQAVSCTSARACTAVGTSDAGQRLAERWNGATWTIQSTPGIGSLLAVSCTSARACTAVGQTTLGSGFFQTATLAEHWNGSRWAVQHTATSIKRRNSSLGAVSCVSARACAAVGHFNGATLAERYS